MRHPLFSLGLALFVFAMPIASKSAETVTFSVRYGTVNLGSWAHYAAGKSKAGTYDGASFDSGSGSGFPTVTLSRPSNAADGRGLFASLKPPNMPLTIQARKKNVIVSTITCEKATPSDFGINGETGKVPEVLVFACTKILTTPTKFGPRGK
jgi:hypothetical protein